MKFKPILHEEILTGPDYTGLQEIMLYNGC